MGTYEAAEIELSAEERAHVSANITKWSSEPKLEQLVVIGHSPSPNKTIPRFPALSPASDTRKTLDALFGNSLIIENAIRINANVKIYREFGGKSGFEFEPALLRLKELVSLLAPKTRPYKTLFVSLGGGPLEQLQKAIWYYFDKQPAPAGMLGLPIAPKWRHDELNIALLGMWHPSYKCFSSKIQEEGWSEAIKRLTENAF